MAKTKDSKETAEPILRTVPEYCTSDVIAALIRRDVRRVQQLTRSGILTTEVPPFGGMRRYKTCETIEKIIAYKEAKAKEKSGAAQLEELKLKKLEAEIKLKESQGTLHQLKTAIAEGKYVESDEAEQELAAFLREFKKFTLNMPARVVRTITGETDTLTIRRMEKVMCAEIESMLETFVSKVLETGCDEK